MPSNLNWCFMQQLDLTQWSTRMWFWRGKKHWTLDMDSKGEKKKSIHIQEGQKKQAKQKRCFWNSCCLQCFFTLLKLAISAAEGLLRKHKPSSRAVCRLHHWDTGIAVLQINNTTNSWRNFRGQWRPDSVSSAHVNARYAAIWGHKYVNWVVYHEGKIPRIRPDIKVEFLNSAHPSCRQWPASSPCDSGHQRWCKDDPASLGSL